jgi:SAM-dependent methyltransferase
MASNPFASRSFIRDVMARGPAERHASIPRQYVEREVLAHLAFAAERGLELTRGARILDFGCGRGDTVRLLVDMGYDAFGVDALDHWSGDFDEFWGGGPKPEGELLSRLHLLDMKDYRLPFPDDYFDFCFSNQVLEHVYNYEEVFRELARVTNPSGFSVHRFPGPNMLEEGHIFVPLPALCRFKSWLALWAVLGRGKLDYMVLAMQTAHYPTKRSLHSHAERVGVALTFHDRDGIRLRTEGQAARILRQACKLGLGRFGLIALSIIGQRYMVLRRL